MEELGPAFFERNPLVCARELIGCVFRWHGCEGRIVETEAYAEHGDPACHTWSRPSARDFIARHDPGTAYVYLNYGVHWLFNVLVKGPEGSGFVLIRALEPLVGMDRMRRRRGDMPNQRLCSGPGKLTKSMGIQGIHHGIPFLKGGDTGLYRGGTLPVLQGGRIGISKATEFPWRFGAIGSNCLSRKF